MEEKLIQIKNDAVTRVIAADDEEEINRIKLELIGKNGLLTKALKELPKLPIDQRPAMGRLANEIKQSIETLINDKVLELKKSSFQKLTLQGFDITLPGIKPALGHLHLVTQAIEEITAIFEKIGFYRVRYPEVEWDWYAFGALNFPENHPARDDWETFFIDETEHETLGGMVLTPHTSSGQIREMTKGKLPIKMLNIAKCYRRQSDVSHTQMFHQFETLCVAERISIKHLKGVLDYFAKSYFGESRKTRIRPYHFQFTEPSFEVDISCGVCNGTGKIGNEKCRLCKEGWLEMGGAGMVHPKVLKASGIDPKKYTGFASGWGVERVLMMKEGMDIDDLRLLYSNNLDFIEQF